MKKLGIMKETKNKWERRVALNPEAVKTLVEKGFEVVIQPSDIRIYTQDEYEKAGAVFSEDLSDCDFISGVKEIPIDKIIPGIPHLFFSHTIKGQDYNMPLLQKFLDTKTTLLDYERIVNKDGKRLVFFGKFAGNAGMIDTLWGAGQRLLKQNGIETPFLKVKQSYEYSSLENALEELKVIGEEISTNGLPEELAPFNIMLLGYGHVARGCREVLETLPIEYIQPEELEKLKGNYSNKKLYVVVFKEHHLAARKDGSDFDLQHYFKNGKEYKSIFAPYIKHTSIYVNAIYWTPDYPVFLPREELKKVQGKDQKMIIIGDITCDINGSVEPTVKATYPDKPVFVYNAETSEIQDGFEGEGFADCAVDNLPCEFSREASDSFSAALMPFMEATLLNDYSKQIKDSDLPFEIRKACIAHNGKLEDEYKFLEKYL